MRWARALVLTMAIGCAAGAATIVRKAAHAPAPRAAQSAPLPVELMVMRRAVAAGEMVKETDVGWQPWPAVALPADAIQRQPGASPPRFEPGRARYPLLAGELVAEAKLVRPGDGGAMAALIAPGMRAVAVPVREESAAGGLIQPNDRVDVLWTRRAPEGSADSGSPTRTILRGAKVLAIGRATEAKSRGVDGRTATLELTPRQAATAATARASGEISLALIPAADLAAITQEDAGELGSEPRQMIKVMKFGRQPSASPGYGGPR